MTGRIKHTLGGRWPWPCSQGQRGAGGLSVHWGTASCGQEVPVPGEGRRGAVFRGVRWKPLPWRAPPACPALSGWLCCPSHSAARPWHCCCLPAPRWLAGARLQTTCRYGPGHRGHGTVRLCSSSRCRRATWELFNYAEEKALIVQSTVLPELLRGPHTLLEASGEEMELPCPWSL